MFPRLLPAAALSLAALCAPAAALDLDAMTEAERAAFRAEVRAYLLDNPEVLMEAIAVLETRQAAEQAQADADLLQVNAEALFNDPTSWVGGNPEGDITVVEFLDYRCGYCKRAHPEVEQLIARDGNIRLIVKEFPILGEQSVVASQFALSVFENAGPDAYKLANDALMKMRGQVAEGALRGIAEGLELDADQILAGMSSPSVQQTIANNRALAQRLQISGTPSFVFESEMVRGYVPLDQMEQLVAQLRAE